MLLPMSHKTLGTTFQKILLINYKITSLLHINKHLAKDLGYLQLLKFHHHTKFQHI